MNNLVKICIEGTKGAGKSTTTRALIQRLEAKGWLVESFAPYGPESPAQQLAQSRGYKNAAQMYLASAAENLELLQCLFASEQQAAHNFAQQVAAHRAQHGDTPAVLLFDRGWLTHHIYLLQGAAFKAGDAGQRAALQQQWQNVLSNAPPTLFIHTTPAESARRRQGQLGAEVGLVDMAALKADYERRHKLAAQYPQKILAMVETGLGPFRDLSVELAPLIEDVQETTPLLARIPRPALLANTVSAQNELKCG